MFDATGIISYDFATVHAETFENSPVVEIVPKHKNSFIACIDRVIFAYVAEGFVHGKVRNLRDRVQPTVVQMYFYDTIVNEQEKGDDIQLNFTPSANGPLYSPKRTGPIDYFASMMHERHKAGVDFYLLSHQKYMGSVGLQFRIQPANQPPLGKKRIV